MFIFLQVYLVAHLSIPIACTLCKRVGMQNFFLTVTTSHILELWLRLVLQVSHIDSCNFLSQLG